MRKKKRKKIENELRKKRRHNRGTKIGKRSKRIGIDERTTGKMNTHKGGRVPKTKNDCRRPLGKKKEKRIQTSPLSKKVDKKKTLYIIQL